MQKAFRFRLEPNREQRQMFVRFAGCCRFIFNHGLAASKEAYEKSGKSISYTDQCKALTILKQVPGMEWLREVDAQVLQQALKDLDSAYQHFFRRLKRGTASGFPRFKRKGLKDAFRYPQRVKVKNNRVFLPKIGWVRYRNSRPIEGRLLQATIKREGDHWFICIVCDVEVASAPQTPTEASSVVGIDVGLKRFATLSEGTAIENPRFFRYARAELKSAQRALTRKRRYSKSWLRQLRRVVKIYAKVRNRRNDFLHKLSTQIVKNHDAIVVENLNINGMVKNRRLSAAICDVGWGKFIDMLKYKAAWAGKSFVQVGRFSPTSQTCSQCGARRPMPISLRMYECEECGLKLDRDLNASRNIRAAGLAVLGIVPNACGGA